MSVPLSMCMLLGVGLYVVSAGTILWALEGTVHGRVPHRCRACALVWPLDLH